MLLSSQLLRSLYKFAVFGFLIGTADTTFAQPDYSSAHWNPPACTKYYTTGNGRSFLVIHDMEGYYEASISYLNRCDTDTNGNYNVSASVHYLVNGIQNGPGENDPADPAAGDITQSVRESNYAWHAVCLNRWSFGTEHEGFVSNPAWYTESMYVASAALQRYLCLKYGIPMDRNHIVGHGEWQNSGWTTWLAASFPSIDPTCNTHTDPGIYWDWSHFMTLITGTNFGTYWDLNDDTAGAGSAPSGRWDATSQNWSGNAYGTNTHGFWGGKIAIFSAGSDATAAYTITNVGTQTVNGLWVKDGSPTFTGGQLNFDGDGSFFTNYVAAGRTATFNLPFGGPSSPDKWGPGTAIYNMASTSGGFFSLNEGTLAVGNNSALGTGRFVIGDPNGANFVTLKSADATAHVLANRLVFNANNCSFGAGGDLTFSGSVDLGANSSTPTTLYVSNNVTTFSGPVTNTAGFIKTGPGTLALSGVVANTYGSNNANGNTTISGGTLRLNKTEGLNAIANGTITINPVGTLALSAADQIADSVNLTLSGGAFQTGGFNEQLGTLRLTASSSIDLGGGATILRFAASSAVAWTAATTLSISNWTGSVNGGGSDQLIFGTNNSALTSAQVNQIRFVNPAGLPAATYVGRILSTGEVVPFTIPPSMVTQPTNQVAIVGDTVAFIALASGTPTPVYQWQFYGTNLPGATATRLQLTSVNLAQSGPYAAFISNAAGSITSATGTLSIYNSAAATLTPSLSLSNPTQFTIGITGVPGYKYSIQTSTNLLDWTALQTNPSASLFTDPILDTNPYRFYRAQWVP